MAGAARLRWSPERLWAHTARASRPALVCGQGRALLLERVNDSGFGYCKGRISRCGDELARTALYEAAHSLLIRSTKWSALRAWGMAIAKRRGMARARVAVARKLGVILHRMWADGSEFRWGKQAATPATVA